jgi:hypothetical protein
MRAELFRKGAMPAVSRAGYFTKPPRTDFQTLREFNGKPDYLYGDATGGSKARATKPAR